MTDVNIEFGALAKPISEQLEAQGIFLVDLKAAKAFDDIAWSITLLHLHGIIPDSVRDRAREKLMKKIVRSEWTDDRKNAADEVSG